MSPFMVKVHRFAVAFQLASLAFVAVLDAVHPDPYYRVLAAWCFAFGVYSSASLVRHRQQSAPKGRIKA